MAIVRPAGIECPKWEPTVLGSKRCRYYIDPEDPNEAGLCKLPDELLCVEWVRRNGSVEQKRMLPRTLPTQPRGLENGARDPHAPAPLALVAQDPPPPRAPARLKTVGGEVTMAPPKPFEPAKAIDPASLEALEAAGIEVELSAPHLDGGITLVPARTGRTDRSEMTFREAAVLRQIVDCFPGAHVTAYRAGDPGLLERSTGIGLLHDPMKDVFVHSLEAPVRVVSVTEAQYAADMGIDEDNQSFEEDPLS